jgi:toxin FitB
MMLLDTNVLSELRKASRCNPAVVAWQREQPLEEQFVSAITLLELKLGIELAGRRNPDFSARLEIWYDTKIKRVFRDRTLPVDTTVAETCARMHAIRPRPYRDALIAATAVVHGLTVITRNTDDFSETGAKVFNPWLFRPGTGEK